MQLRAGADEWDAPRAPSSRQRCAPTRIDSAILPGAIPDQELVASCKQGTEPICNSFATFGFIGIEAGSCNPMICR